MTGHRAATCATFAAPQICGSQSRDKHAVLSSRRDLNTISSYWS